LSVLDADTFQLGEGFQSKLIALCLRDPGFLQSHLDVIKPHFFETHSLSTIMSLVDDHFRKHFVVPSREVLTAVVCDYSRTYGGDKAGELRGTLSAYVDYIYSLDLSDSAYVAEKVVAFGQRQAVKEAVGRTIDLLERRDDTSKIRQVFDEALRVGSTRDPGTDFCAIAANLPQMLLNDPIYGAANKVPTGFAAIDQMLYGGIGVGEVAVVAGPPSRGKSTVLVNLAKNAAYHFKRSGKNKCVFYITLEGGMKEIHISAKFAAALTGIDINNIVMGDPKYPETMARQLSYLGQKAIRIKYFSPASMDLEDLRWYIANVMSSEGVDPGLIIIDYADKLKGMEDDRYREAGTIYDGLTGLGDKFQCPVYTGSQINRTWAEEEVIGMRGLAESWLKCANSDVIMTLNQTDTEKKAGVVRIHMAKARNGEDKGIIYCHWKPSCASVWAMCKEEVDAIAKKP
jgi:replicative DNA helicase